MSDCLLLLSDMLRIVIYIHALQFFLYIYQKNLVANAAVVDQSGNSVKGGEQVGNDSQFWFCFIIFFVYIVSAINETFSLGWGRGSLYLISNYLKTALKTNEPCI